MRWIQAETVNVRVAVREAASEYSKGDDPRRSLG
jgi:hypothetical protein